MSDQSKLTELCAQLEQHRNELPWHWRHILLPFFKWTGRLDKRRG